jgi:hypothetical protein
MNIRSQETFDSGDSTSQLLDMSEHFCSYLLEHRELGTIRVSLAQTSWLGKGGEIVQQAERYGLRCWFAQHDLVLQAPETGRSPRIDKRGALPVVTFRTDRNGDV